MKLSKQAIDDILHVIATFDRERGIPHDYRDLEVVLGNTQFKASAAGDLDISHEETLANTTARIDGPLDDASEGRAMLVQAAREWLE